MSFAAEHPSRRWIATRINTGSEFSSILPEVSHKTDPPFHDQLCKVYGTAAAYHSLPGTLGGVSIDAQSCAK